MLLENTVPAPLHERNTKVGNPEDDICIVFLFLRLSQVLKIKSLSVSQLM
ncbi:hypothetical protein P4S68_14435 [Pseudoalteromonas sp. Hal099]